MIELEILTDFKDLLGYIDDYLLDLLNEDGFNTIPEIYKDDLFLKFTYKGNIVGIIKYTPIGDYPGMSIHPMFKKEHRIYSTRCIKMSFDYINEMGIEIVMQVFPSCYPAAEKMALWSGAKKYGELPDRWTKNGKNHSMMIYKLEL